MHGEGGMDDCKEWRRGMMNVEGFVEEHGGSAGNALEAGEVENFNVKH